MSRFRAKADDDTLLDGVAGVLEPMGPEARAALSQRAFDAAAASAGLPSAAQICRRLRLAWPDAKEVAMVDSRQRMRALAARRREPAAPVSRDEACRAVALMAGRAGTASLRPDQYQAQWQEMERRRRAAWRHGARAALLPSLNQLAAYDWDELLAGAGLGQRERDGTRAPTPADAIEAFIEAFGLTPSRHQATRWAAASGAALGRWTGGMAGQLAIVRQHREERGLPMPPRAQRDSEISPAAGVPAAPFAAPKRRKRWTMEEVIAGVALALDKLEPGERLSQASLRRVAKGDPRIPSASAVTRIASEQGLSLDEVRRLAAAVGR